MTWEFYLVETMTGHVGARLDATDSGSWSIPLNGIEEFAVTVRKSQLRRIDRHWWAPWSGALLAVWQADGESTPTPWLLGPIVAPPAETRDFAELKARGLGALLNARTITAEDTADGPALPAVPRGDLSVKGASLGTIAQEVVKRATNGKLAGTIPIRFASPRETGSRLNERNYRGWNLANNIAFKRLTEITNVRGGPDIAFRPEWANDTRTMVRWAMHHGTAAQQAIWQDWTMDLDTRTERGPIASVEMTASADNVANRVWWTGAGEGEAVLIRYAQDTSRMRNQHPLIERVGSTSDSDNPSLVQTHANAALAAGANPIVQISVTVDGADPRCQIGRWRVGDEALLTMGPQWLQVPEGTSAQRIIAASGSWSSDQVKLEFQPDGEVFDGEEAEPQ